MTLGLVSVVVLVGSLAGFYLRQRAKPVAYRPDERFQEITSSLSAHLPAEAPRPRMTQVTGPAGLGDFRNFAGVRTSQLPEDMGPGLAWGDFDQDGDDDLFLVSAGGSLGMPRDRLEPCRLMENLGDGVFRRVTGFPEVRVWGMGAAWGDYDGDGYPDLAVSAFGELRLWRNQGGTGRFEAGPVLPSADGFWSGVSWCDFDGDLRLDLYACRYVAFSVDESARDVVSDQLGSSVPFTLNPASYPPAPNALFRQRSDGTFENVASERGVENPEGRSLGALWHDFDLDGWPDLYVANDVSDNVLYLNEGGWFRDVSHAAWVADYRSAMGLAAGDYDRDGDDDLFISHWVAQENGFYQNQFADFSRPPPQGVRADVGGVGGSEARALANTGARPSLRFVDIADQVGLGQISLRLVGWGSEFADFDGDGWLDLVCVNGSTLENEGPPPRTLQAQPLFLFWNQRGRAFFDLASLDAELRRPVVARGLACADYDADGDIDVAIAELGEGVRLLRNEATPESWIRIRPRARHPSGTWAATAPGAIATLWVGGVPMRRAVDSASYLSQSSSTLQWAWRGTTRVDRLEIVWRAGAKQSLSDVHVNESWAWREGEGALVRLTARGEISGKEEPRRAVKDNPSDGAIGSDERDRLMRFWVVYRAALRTLKEGKDPAAALAGLEEAVALNPGHADAIYNLAQACAELGRTTDALKWLEHLRAQEPRGHRAWLQWGSLRARTARSAAELAESKAALERAYSLNPEETGAPLALGAVAILRGDDGEAARHLSHVLMAHPRSVGALFLDGYLRFSRGDASGARERLEAARVALGPDWKPAGSTSEGDAHQKHFREAAPLAVHWENWNGSADPVLAFEDLQRFLRSETRSTAFDPRSL